MKPIQHNIHNEYKKIVNTTYAVGSAATAGTSHGRSAVKVTTSTTGIRQDA